MVSIARRNIFAEKGRLFISVGGVAFAVLLILVLWGLYRGWNRALTLYIENVPADLWVVQEGSRADMFHSVSLIPRDVQSQLAKVPGVQEVHPFVGRSVAFSWKGDTVTTYLVGYEPGSGLAGPRRIIKGKADPGPGEVIIDKVFSRNKGIKIGDKLPVGGRELEVVGIAEGGNMFLYQFSFLRRDEAESLLRMTGFANYYLIRLEKGQSTAQAIDEIKASVPGVKAFTRAQFAENNRALVSEAFLPIILVLVLIGFAVGTVVIALTIYTATMEKSREYGVLKAIGATNRNLYGIVLEQSLISSVLGYVVGVFLSFIVIGIAGQLVPVFTTDIRAVDLAGVLVMALLMGAAASYFPLSRLVRVDPALVFRS